MICLECVNGLRRDMPGKTEVVCCLDSRLVMSVFKCNFFFRAVDDRPIVESVLPDLKYEVEDTKRKIMTSHYQDIVQRLKEEQKGIDPVDEVYGKSLVEDVNEYMQKEQQGVAEKVAFEQDRMTVEDLMKRAVGLVKEGEKACKEICGEMEVPGSSVMERADEFIEQIEENSRKIIENDIKLAELKRGRGRPRKT